ncbi:MAG: hypothetical protein WDO24_05760 [Pseudomonadota bacterium]
MSGSHSRRQGLLAGAAVAAIGAPATALAPSAPRDPWLVALAEWRTLRAAADRLDELYTAEKVVTDAGHPLRPSVVSWARNDAGERVAISHVWRSEKAIRAAFDSADGLFPPQPARAIRRDRLIAELRDATAAWERIPVVAVMLDADARHDAAETALAAHEDAMMAAPAATLEGARAKLAWALEVGFVDRHDMMVSLTNDLERLAREGGR